MEDCRTVCGKLTAHVMDNLSFRLKELIEHRSSTLNGQLLLWLDYCLKRVAWALKAALSNRAERYRDVGKSPASTRGLVLFNHISSSWNMHQWLKVRKNNTWVIRMTLWIKWKLKQDDLPPSRGDLCITGDKDVVAQSPGFPMWDPQQCSHPAGDRSLPGRLYSHVPLSSLGLAC